MRGKGEGAVYQDAATGRWIGQLDLGRDAAGKRQRRKVTGRTKSEVTRRLTELRKQRGAGTDVATKAPTIADLARDWLAQGAPGPRGVKQASTLARLSPRIEQHLVRGIGHHRIDHLRVEHVDAWLASEAAAGISRRTLLDYRGDLRQLINQEAIRRRLVQHNVAILARIPQGAVGSDEKVALTRHEREALYEELGKVRTVNGSKKLPPERLGSYFVLAAEMGLRPGELDGLRWSDVDFEGESIYIKRAIKRDDRGQALDVGPTKTRRSSRPLRLTGRSVAALRQRRAAQASERLVSGSAWTSDARWEDLVFTSEVGTPLNPSNVRRTLTKVCDRAGIPRVSPYELRHTAASVLAEDLPLERVAHQLGHVDTRMVERHYLHAPPIIEGAAEVERRHAGEAS